MLSLNVDNLSKDLTKSASGVLETNGVRLEYAHHKFDDFHVNVMDYHINQETEFVSELPYRGFDLSFTLHGECALRSDTGNIKYASNQLLISNGGYTSSSLHVGSGMMSCFGIGVSYEFLNKFYKDFDVNTNIILENTSIAPIARLYIEQILRADKSDPLSKIYIQSKALDIIYMHFQDLKNSFLTQKGVMFDEFDKKALIKAREILSAELQNPPSISDLSKRVKLNEFKLKLGFKRLFSQTPYEFLRDLRMRVALDLVQNSQMNLFEISTRIGLKSQSHFTKLFYERYKTLPKDLMKKRRYYF